MFRNDNDIIGDPGEEVRHGPVAMPRQPVTGRVEPYAPAAGFADS